MYSSSVPQRVHSASWSLTTLPQPGHWRRRLVELDAVEHRGDQPEERDAAAEIRNQSQKLDPLTLPTTPPARPKKKTMTRYRHCLVR